MDSRSLDLAVDKWRREITFYRHWRYCSILWVALVFTVLREEFSAPGAHRRWLRIRINRISLLIHLETKSISVRGTSAHFVTDRPTFLKSSVEFVARLTNLSNSAVSRIIFAEKTLRSCKRYCDLTKMSPTCEESAGKKYDLTEHCIC